MAEAPLLLDQLLCGLYPIDGSLINPSSSEGVVYYRNGVVLHGVEGALIVSSVRLLFIPGFIDVNKLASEMVGSAESGKTLSEVAAMFESNNLGNVDEIEAALKSIDTDGSGTLDADELKTFLIKELKPKLTGRPAAIISFSHSSIVSLASSAGVSSTSLDTDDKPRLLSFPSDALQTSVTSFATTCTHGLNRTFYKIEIKSSATSETWTVERRYSEFGHLRDDIQARTSSTLPKLPPKGYLHSVVLEDRRLGLDAFLTALLGTEGARGESLAEFLGASAALRAAAENEEADDEEKVETLLPDQCVVAAFLAHAQPCDSTKKGKELLLLTKVGTCFIFRVPDAETPATEWCSALNAYHSACTKDTFEVPDLSLFPARNATWLSGGALMRSEYERMGAFATGSKWRPFDNGDYTFSPTYPSVFAVPKSVEDDVVEGSAKQRSKRRVPALTWLHPNGAPLCRSSQPLAGLKGLNEHNLKYPLLDAIQSAADGSTLLLVDARPKLNARANAVAGKGFEDCSKIQGPSQIFFFDIANIHAMRKSLALLATACQVGDDSFYEKVAASGWLKHVKMVLRGANEMVDALEQKMPVLVHCSDGWDRTSQLAAVAQLLLDPYYRTISGFGALIEKDFCSFGHMFAKRSDPSSSEYSPIFLQFLDCCWQVLRQFPGAFEFNAQFLLTIVEGQQSSWSATFRGDCESERKDATGPCLWQLIDLENCRNAAYVPAAPGAPPLRPKVAMQAIHLWSDLYFLHSPLV